MAQRLARADSKPPRQTRQVPTVLRPEGEHARRFAALADELDPVGIQVRHRISVGLLRFHHALERDERDPVAQAECPGVVVSGRHVEVVVAEHMVKPVPRLGQRGVNPRSLGAVKLSGRARRT